MLNVKKLKLKDPLEFSRLVKQFQSKMYGLALKITRNPHDAEEVVQEALVKIYKKLNSFREQSQLSTWIYRITVNTALMRLRSQKSNTNLTNALVNPPKPPSESHNASQKWHSHTENTLLRKELMSSMQAAVDQLPTKLKTIFLLKDVEELPTQEIAEIMNLSIPAVKSRLHRARAFLRDYLQNYLEEESPTS